MFACRIMTPTLRVALLTEGVDRNLLSLHNKSPCPGRLQRYLLHFALPQTRGFTLNASTFTAFDTVAAELAPSVAARGFSPVAVPSPDSAGWIL